MGRLLDEKVKIKIDCACYSDAPGSGGDWDQGGVTLFLSDCSFIRAAKVEIMPTKKKGKR